MNALYPKRIVPTWCSAFFVSKPILNSIFQKQAHPLSTWHQEIASGRGRW